VVSRSGLLLGKDLAAQVADFIVRVIQSGHVCGLPFLDIPRLGRSAGRE
jgi:hypothetical protein